MRNTRASSWRTLRCVLPNERSPAPKVDVRAASSVRSAYVHLPFCKRRCHYCDFPIHVLGAQENATSRRPVGTYVETLCKEIRQTMPRGFAPLETVFFGGGTPSLIPPRDLDRVIATLSQSFGFTPNLEMSMEADPGTFDAAKLREYVSLGVNRLSLGVQCFDDSVLELCGRSHTLADVYAAIRDVQGSAISSWSLDLISGLPHSTLTSWRATLERALDAQPDHISVYDLQIESGTRFSRLYRVEVEPLPSQELSAEMYELASSMLTSAGYEHYEVSNYAKPGHRCRHNMMYWTRRPFYGFGMGATSYFGEGRLARPKGLKQYAVWVDGMPHAEDAVEGEDAVLETLMLRLRLRDGVHLESFRSEFGRDAENQLRQAVEPQCSAGLVECLDANADLLEGWTEEANRIRLRDPEGFLLSNEILAAIFQRLDPIQ